MSLLPSIGDELAAHHHYRRVRSDRCLLSAQDALAAIHERRQTSDRSFFNTHIMQESQATI
jgi:hypothetical protein